MRHWCPAAVLAIVFVLGQAARDPAPQFAGGASVRKLQDLIPVYTNPIAPSSDWVTQENPVIVNTNAPPADYNAIPSVPQGTPPVSADTCSSGTWNDLCNSCVSVSLTDASLSCSFPENSDMADYDAPKCCSKLADSAPPGSDGMLCCAAPDKGSCADQYGEYYSYEHCCMSDRCVG